jgi:Ca2+-binding RTX toxin-like protein
MDAGTILFVVIGAGFAVGGFAVLLNIFGAADRAAAYNLRSRDDPSREPGTYPETRAGMRLWGLMAMVCGAVPAGIGISELSADTTTVSCAYKGAPARVLTVTVGDSVAQLRRRGTQIEVREQGEGIARCSGATPTVRNTDTMRIVLAEVSFVDLDLGGGAFAPGATREREGASEIEIELSVDLGTADVYGTDGDDEWHWGPGGANPALNLNPRVAGDRDVDVRILGSEDAYGALTANGGDGDDTIIGAPDARIHGQLIAYGDAGDDLLSTPVIAGEREFGAELHGGPGDDTISGGGHEDELSGDAGNDRIDGGASADKITAGRGRDRIAGGAGADTISARDGVSEAISCGPGRDRATVDTFDELRDCE